MRWILMHPTYDEESQRIVKILRETVEHLFDLSKNATILRTLVLRYQSFVYFESKYNSFLGETAYVRWGIWTEQASSLGTAFLVVM